MKDVNRFASWKPKLAGAAAILTGVAGLIAAISGGPVSWTAVAAALGLISNGVGNWNSRQDNVTSEEAGAK